MARPKQNRFVAFGKYFKNYMSVAATVTAAMPLGAAGLRAIPVYSSLERVLAAYASLFCFLLFAYVFYIRQSLARAMFSSGELSRAWKVIPLALIALAVACGLGYLAALQQSVQAARDSSNVQGIQGVTAMADVLRTTDYIDAPLGFMLILLYLGFFMFAEAAFALMAAREYLQDELKLSEVAILATISRPPG
jgi:hypothetical protein